MTEHSIELLTIHCPMCVGVERLLKNKNISFTMIDDEQEILKRGFTHSPILIVDGVAYSGEKIRDIIHEIGEGK